MRQKPQTLRTNAPGLPPRLATQALLHPTGKPVESSGPTSGAGHAGPRSTGHEATEQFAAEGIIDIGRLYPSTRDTAMPGRYTSCALPLRTPRTVVIIEIPGALKRPFCYCRWRHTLQNPRVFFFGIWQEEDGGRWCVRTVPLRGSHWSPPLHPPSRQALGPIVVEEKLQSRRP